MRRLPHQGARHGTVDHGDTSDSAFFLIYLCFLRVERSFFEDLPPLSLACGWPLGVNGSLSCEWRRLHELRVEAPSGTRKKGSRTEHQSGPGRPAWVDWPRPIPARFGRPFTFVGPHVFMHFAPSTSTILTISSSRPRWRFSLHEVRSFTLQSSVMFLCNTSVLATIGSDFIKLINTNKTP
jgi:hypothetical protein